MGAELINFSVLKTLLLSMYCHSLNPATGNNYGAIRLWPDQSPITIRALDIERLPPAHDITWYFFFSRAAPVCIPISTLRLGLLQQIAVKMGLLAEKQRYVALYSVCPLLRKAEKKLTFNGALVDQESAKIPTTQNGLETPKRSDRRFYAPKDGNPDNSSERKMRLTLSCTLPPTHHTFAWLSKTT